MAAYQEVFVDLHARSSTSTLSVRMIFISVLHNNIFEIEIHIVLYRSWYVCRFKGSEHTFIYFRISSWFVELGWGCQFRRWQVPGFK